MAAPGASGSAGAGNANADGASETWELVSKATDEELKRRRSPILFAACTGDFILTGSCRPMVQLWRLGEGEITHHGTLKSIAAPTCIECAQDQNQVAISAQNGQILLFDLREQQRAATILPSTMAQATTVCFVGDSHRLATGGCSGKLCLWDLRRPHTVEVEIPPYLDLNGAAKEENGEVGRPSNPSKRRREGSTEPPETPEVSHRISSLCASHDGQLIACGRDSGYVALLRLQTLQWVTGDVEAHMKGGTVRSLSFDQRSRFLLSGGDDSNVCLMDAGHWSSQGRKPCVERFLAHRKRVTSLKVSPDLREQLAVSTSWDGLVKLWDYRTQRLLCSFDEHVPSPVTALAFAPVDGRFFVTTGGDAKLALFARR